MVISRNNPSDPREANSVDNEIPLSGTDADIKNASDEKRALKQSATKAGQNLVNTGAAGGGGLDQDFPRT